MRTNPKPIWRDWYAIVCYVIGNVIAWSLIYGAFKALTAIFGLGGM